MLHFALVNGLLFPANAARFTKILVQAVSFDFLPKDEIESVVFNDLRDEEPISSDLELVGYESRLLIRNAASIVYHAASLLALVSIVLLLARCCGCKCIQKLRNALIYNTLIRFWLETFFELTFTAGLNLIHGDWDN